MRLLCDQMLSGLGRWLRAAGYDTLIITTSIDDKEIFVMAEADKRQLITRDRHFLAMKGAEDTVCHLTSNTLPGCSLEIKEKLAINWLYKPFSRCIICNTIFIKAEDKMLLERLPCKVQETASHIYYCTSCDKLYWQGTHTERMLKKLTEWQKTH